MSSIQFASIRILDVQYLNKGMDTFEEYFSLNELYTGLSKVIGLIKNPESFKNGITLTLGGKSISWKLNPQLEPEFVQQAIAAAITTLSSIQEPAYEKLDAGSIVKNLYATAKNAINKKSGTAVTKPITDFYIISSAA